MRLALLSFWHVHAADYARESLLHPDVDLALIWDEHPDRGRVEAGARDIRFESDLDVVLSDPSIDGVVVTSATTVHASLILAAARAGKHIFAEKVIATTFRESLEIVNAVESARVTMMIALTRTTDPSAIRALEIVHTGEIGTPTSARVRLAHDGALPTPDRADGWLPNRFFRADESGGGSLIDLGAHPLYLTRLFLGMPARVTTAFGDFTGRGADDNAAVLFHYANGAIGVVETGFVNRGRGFLFEISGTEGSVAYDDTARELWLHRRRGDSIQIDLPQQGPTPFEQWVSAVQSGASTQSNLNLALDLSALAEAATQSAAKGRTIHLDDIVRSAKS